jgi:hypothetical protein
MARKLSDGDVGEPATAGTRDGSASKGLLNRREYVTLGAVAVAAAFGLDTGTTAVASGADDSVQTYATGFGAYAE